MKIWVIEIGEPLPLENDVRLHRYGQFTKALATLGHDVVWWTSSFSHAPKKNFVDSDKELVIDGVKLKFIYSKGYARNISFARILHNRRFARRFSEWARESEVPDLIIAPIPTIETAEAAVRFALEKNVPVLVDIRDHWPEELVNLVPPFLRPVARIALGESFQRMHFVCGNASGIMGVSQKSVDYGLSFAGRQQGGKDRIFPLGYSNKKVPEEKMIVAREWCREIGIDADRFVCCFFGTIGQYFDLETVIKVAGVLEKELNLQFVLAGDGDRLREYKSMASGLSNVIFPGWLDEPRIAAVMELSQVGLAPYAAGTLMSLPNKPFEYMAGGLPIVSSIQHELKGILEKYRCGRTYQADSEEQLCGILRDLYLNPGKCREMGQNARRLFEEQFSTDSIFRSTADHLEGVCRTSQGHAFL